ncbi:MAG: diguanylate cyclase [Nitrospirae bacterium]|nr:diguanylate cyclase [Nitrospirota bacterium]
MRCEILKNIKILYVEDEQKIRETLVKSLKRQTGEVIVAENGAMGLEMFNLHNPDIVITDIRMPVMNGLDMARQIKAINCDVPLIITTGHNDEEFLLTSIDIGVDKYIKKPIYMEELFSTLEKFSIDLVKDKALEAQKEFIQLILDISPVFIMILEDKKITYLNKAFLNFTDNKTIEDFTSGRSTIDRYFLQSDDFFYKDRIFNDWINDVINAPEKEYKVLMASERRLKEKGKICLLRARKIPDVFVNDRYLLSFTDITTIESERQLYFELAMKDPLTDIYNRLKFFDALNEQVMRSQRYGHMLSLIIFDIDLFKNVNDTYGHPAGDYVLRTIADIVKNSIRKPDVFARYGGEEFVILLPDTKLDGAMDVAEKLRQEIECYRFHDVGRVTCSLGVSELHKDEDADLLLKKADQALYVAKQQGRNQVQTVCACKKID